MTDQLASLATSAYQASLKRREEEIRLQDEQRQKSEETARKAFQGALAKALTKEIRDALPAFTYHYHEIHDGSSFTTFTASVEFSYVNRTWVLRPIYGGGSQTENPTVKYWEWCYTPGGGGDDESSPNRLQEELLAMIGSLLSQ